MVSNHFLPHFPRTTKVKVTGKNSKGKKLSKSLKCAVTVKNPSIALSQTEASLAIGDTVKLAATTKPASIQSAVTYTTSDENIATVAADGTVTAVAEGSATVTATVKNGTKEVKATATITVAKYAFKSVKQTKANTLEAVIAGDTKSIKPADIVITNKSTNVVKPVKTVTVDSADATKVTFETFADVTDGKVYTVALGGAVQEFTATDGVVAAVGLDKTEVAPNTDTRISAELKDANGVLLDTVAYPGDSKVSIDITVDYNDGYPTAEGILLYEKGKTATADITYHSGKYDETTGAEIGNVEAKGIVITAGEAATISGWKVKVGKNATDFTTVEEKKLAVDDTDKYAYIQTTDSKGSTSVDITGYTLESSDNDALILGAVDAVNGKIALTPVKAGTSYLIVKDTNGNVVASIPVVIDAKRKATTLTLDKAAVTLTKNITGDADEATDITVTLNDQYGDPVDASAATFTTLTYNDGSTTATNNTTFNALSVAGGKINVASAGVNAGTYTVKMTVEGLVRTFSVKVQDASAASGTATKKLELSATSADAVIKADMVADTTITAKVYEITSGVKTANITDTVVSSGSSVRLTDSKGNDAQINAPGDVLTVSGGAIVIKVTDKLNGKKLATGRYTLTVTAADGTKYTAAITITDSQSAVSVKRVKTNGNSVDECYEFTYDGKKVDETNYAGSTKTYKNSSGADVTGATGATVAVSSAVVKVKLADGVYVEQTVSIGNSVTIN